MSDQKGSAPRVRAVDEKQTDALISVALVRLNEIKTNNENLNEGGKKLQAKINDFRALLGRYTEEIKQANADLQKLNADRAALDQNSERQSASIESLSIVRDLLIQLQKSLNGWNLLKNEIAGVNANA